MDFGPRSSDPDFAKKRFRDYRNGLKTKEETLGQFQSSLPIPLHRVGEFGAFVFNVVDQVGYRSVLEAAQGVPQGPRRLSQG